VTPFEFLKKYLRILSKVFRATNSKYFVILPCLIERQSMTDSQTDRRTDGHRNGASTIAKMHYSTMCCRA